MISNLSSVLRTFFRGLDISAAQKASISAHEILRPEGPRQYLMALPSQAVSDKRALVIILHGGAGAGARQVLGMTFPASPLSVFLEIAEREQLVVIAPNGTKMGWNDSFADITNKPKTDDVGFISALIDLAIAEHEVDARRVYIIGVSKGGMMAYRLATEIAPKLAAFAALLANMSVKSVCPDPAQAISALLLASTKDPFVPYHGGKYFYTPALSPMKSIDQTLEVWRNLAGLQDTPQRSEIPHRLSTDKTRAIRYDWTSTAHTMQVSLIKVEGGGHAEPSAMKRYPGFMNYLAGAQNADFEIAELAWAFFKDKRGVLDS